MNTDAPKLSVEIIPTSLHGRSPREVNGRTWWDRNRKRAYEAAGHRCEICGGVGQRHPVEAHERYEYDETSKPPCQRLLGLIALCPACHAVKHLYRTHAVSIEQNDPSIYKDALRHLENVNEWNNSDVQSYLVETRHTFRRREALGAWIQDFSSFPDS